MEVWVSRFGVPLEVVMDRGSQLEAELFLHPSETLGFHRIRTPAYHPQANGLVEVLHRTYKTDIVVRKEWLRSLPVVVVIPQDNPKRKQSIPM